MGKWSVKAVVSYLVRQSEWIGQLSGLWVCWLVELSVGQQGSQLASPSWWAGRSIEWVSYLVQWSVWMNRLVERSVSHQLIGCTINLFVSQLSCTAVEDKFIKFEFILIKKYWNISCNPKLQNEHRSKSERANSAQELLANNQAFWKFWSLLYVVKKIIFFYNVFNSMQTYSYIVKLLVYLTHKLSI